MVGMLRGGWCEKSGSPNSDNLRRRLEAKENRLKNKLVQAFTSFASRWASLGLCSLSPGDFRVSCPTPSLQVGTHASSRPCKPINWLCIDVKYSFKALLRLVKTQFLVRCGEWLHAGSSNHKRSQGPHWLTSSLDHRSQI